MKQNQESEAQHWSHGVSDLSTSHQVNNRIYGGIYKHERCRPRKHYLEILTKKPFKRIHNEYRGHAKQQHNDYYEHVDNRFLFPPKQNRILPGNGVLHQVVLTTNSSEDANVVHDWQNEENRPLPKT